MKVQIENLICEWESEATAEVFVRFCNLILLQRYNGEPMEKRLLIVEL